MTQDKLDDLKKRMHNHTVINDTAVVILTANELHELIELAYKQLDHNCQVYYPVDMNDSDVKDTEINLLPKAE